MLHFLVLTDKDILQVKLQKTKDKAIKMKEEKLYCLHSHVNWEQCFSGKHQERTPQRRVWHGRNTYYRVTEIKCDSWELAWGTTLPSNWHTWSC